MNRLFTVLLIMLQSFNAFGQNRKALTDSVFSIKEVSVSVSRIDNFSTGNKIQKIDSSLLASFSTTSLARTLAICSGVQINSYGVGLSNASLRGTGSSHTAVLWNGFNIQDILNGGVDFSQIPTGFFDQVKVQYGGNGALFGSGAIGGAIHLTNSLEFDSGFKASLKGSLGSFSNYFGGADVSYSRSKYSGFIKSYYNKARNNYKYRNTQEFGSPMDVLSNAECEQIGILSGNAFRINRKNSIESFFWYQDYDKNVPKTLVTSSISNQRNDYMRAAATWKYISNEMNLLVRTGFFNSILYYNPLNSNLTNSKNTSNNWVNEAEMNSKISESQRVNVGLGYTLESGKSVDLISNPERNRLSIFASYRFTSHHQKLNIVTSFREELVNSKLTPFTFTLGVEQKVGTFLLLKAKLARNYRLPTINDLYWAGWGNPHLISESGFCQDFGITVSQSFVSVSVKYDLTGFTNMVKDWILWHPSGNIWTPDNISKVWARGIEQNFSIQSKIQDVNVQSSISYSYTKSTKVKKDMPDDQAYQKQLIYVPIHKGNMNAQAAWHGFTLFSGLNYTGKRFTQADNSRQVEGYFTTDINISKTFSAKKQEVNVSFLVNNLGNSVYEVVQYYPMPMRNYQISIQFNLK